MKPVRTAFALLPLLCAAGVAAPPTDEEIRQAVQRLGEAKFAERERATKLLWAAGPTAEKYLREVADSPDPEVKRRARMLLDRIAYRIDPGTPPEVITLMQRYRTGTPEEQAAVLRQLLAMGGKSHPYLIRLLDAVESEKRARILDQFAYDDWKILVPLMADGNETLVEQILEKAAGAQIESVVPHFAVFYAITGRLPAKIAQLRAQVEKSGGAFTARLLVALYRQANDPEGVLWAAERAGQSELVRMVLAERGQWAELLTRYTPSVADGYNRIHGLGLTAAYQRLAGRDAEFQATLKKIEEYASGPRRDSQPKLAAKALLINEQTAAGLDLLIRFEQYQEAAELLFSQLKYADGLALSEKAAKAETGQAYYARVAHVLLLHRVGDGKTGREWLAAVAKDMAASTDAVWLDRQIDLEVKLGLGEQAEKRLLERVERNDGSYLNGCFRSLFPDLDVRAETVWRLLRHRYPMEPPAESLKRLRQIDDGKVAADELAGLLRTIPDAAWVPQAWVPAAFEHLAWVVNRFGRADVAAALLKDSGWEKAPTGARLLLADTLADAKQWPAAAAAYQADWEADRAAALPYFLHGWALVQQGKVEEGRAVMARAHRLLLGADAARRDFHDALFDRGFTKEARLEVPLRARFSQPDKQNFTIALDHVSKLAQETGDPLTAAAARERYLLQTLPTASGLRTVAWYPRWNCTIHALRARGLLAQGKKAEALREVDRAEAVAPACTELPILLFADLERAGEKDRAAQLFDRVYKILDENCRKYPNCADAHNLLAWVSARCRRQLDDALPHALKAVELAPHLPAYIDTLAELHFQRGEKEKAIELARKSIRLSPERAGYYRQQLKRFEKGDPLTEPSVEG
ncbi:MAG: hypothetical protein ACJ8F7_11175 [Gemmataceae bacterium]